MEAKKRRLTLEMDPEFQQRLKVAAERKGMSTRQYCRDAVDRELAKDEANEVQRTPFSIEKLLSLRDEIFQGKKLPGDSTEFIREARESRAGL